MSEVMTFTSLEADLRAYAERGYPSDPTVYAQIPRLISNAERRIATELKIQGFLVPANFSLEKGNPVIEKPDRWRETASINIGVAPIFDIVTFITTPTGIVFQFAKPHPFEVGQQILVEGLPNPLFNGALVPAAVTQLTVTIAVAPPPPPSPPIPVTAMAYTAPNKRKPLFARSYEFIRQHWPDDEVEGEPEFYADYDYNHVIVAPTPKISYPGEWNYYEFLQPLGVDSQTNWLTDYAPNMLLYASLLEMAPFLKSDERIPVWQQAFDRLATGFSQQDMARITDRAAKRDKA